MAICDVVICLLLVMTVSAAPLLRTILNTRQTPPPGFEIVGPVAPHVQVPFTIALQQQNVAQLTETFMQVSDPLSLKYGQYMTNAEILAIVGPSQETANAVLAVLPKEIICKNMGDALRCKGPATAVANAFSTKLVIVRHISSGLRMVRQIGEFSVPTAIRHAISFVSPLSLYAIPERKQAHVKTDLGAGNFAIVPETLTKMYQITEKGDPRSSQGVAEFAEVDWMWQQSDLAAFSQAVGIPISFTKQFGPLPSPSDPLSVEASLDVQYLGAIGVGNTNWVWNEQQWMYDFVIDVLNATDRPSVLSLSYAWSEEEQCIGLTDQVVCNQLKLTNTEYVNRINVEFMKIGLSGISILSASGDSGCHGRTDETCGVGLKANAMYPDFPACSPYVTSVGGTVLTKGVSQGATEPICKTLTCATGGTEVVATTRGGLAAISSGGGFSTVATRPSYQAAFVKAYIANSASKMPPTQYYNNSNRGFPDVAALAHNYVIWAGSQTFVDGTSCATPTWAAIIGLLNAHRIRAGKPVVGFANPLLYAIYTATKGAAFQDITTGDNACTESGCQCKYGFSAVAGWDAVSGLGSPNVAAIIVAMDKMDMEREALLGRHA